MNIRWRANLITCHPFTAWLRSGIPRSHTSANTLQPCLLLPRPTYDGTNIRAVCSVHRGRLLYHRSKARRLPARLVPGILNAAQRPARASRTFSISPLVSVWAVEFVNSSAGAAYCCDFALGKLSPGVPSHPHIRRTNEPQHLNLPRSAWSTLSTRLRLVAIPDCTQAAASRYWLFLASALVTLIGLDPPMFPYPAPSCMSLNHTYHKNMTRQSFFSIGRVWGCVCGGSG